MTREARDSVARVFSGTASADEINLVCPSCGFDYTHVCRVGTLLGSDPGEAKVYPGTAVTGSTGSRRSAVEIVLSCEGCGGFFAVVVQQHKGINYLEVARDVPPVPGFAL